MNTRPPPAARRPRAGFTLIELLTVISIIGILAAILIPTISMAIRRAQESKTKIQLQNLVSMCEMYHDSYKVWPTFSTRVTTQKDTSFRLKDNAPRFVRIMTGKPDSGDNQYNKLGVAFATFKDGDLTNDPESVTPIDSFGNDDLFLVFNTNLSDQGHIMPEIINEVSMESHEGTMVGIKQNESIPVNASCVALSPGAGRNDMDAITTWDVKAPSD